MNGTSSKAILVAIGVVATVGVAGAVFASDNAAQILGFCSLICVSLLGLLGQIRIAIKADDAAIKVEQVRQVAKVAATNVAEVKQDLAMMNANHSAKIDGLAKVADATHTLVNSQHGIALSTVYEQALRIADLTGEPGDRAKADLAGYKLQEHERKQISADAKDAKTSEDTSK